MLLKLAIITSLHTIVTCVDTIKTVKDVKPYVFPIPFELPNRNDRADQCWLRIEDAELIETVTVYCYIAHAFLTNYIHDYNSRKMTEDGVDVSVWIDKLRKQEEDILPPGDGPNGLKDWRTTTVMDPTIHMRLYVPKSADCKLVMYSREGMTNYSVDCKRILYYINVRMTSNSVFIIKQNPIFLVLCIFLIYLHYLRS